MGFTGLDSGGIKCHISPILDTIFNYYLKQLNFKLIKRYYVSFHTHDLNTTRMKVGYILLFLLSLILFPFMIFNRKFLKGIGVIYIIKKRFVDY